MPKPVEKLIERARPSSTPMLGGFGGLGFQETPQDLELRVVFGSEESFTSQSVVNKTTQLPGIQGGMLFQRDGTILAHQLPDEEEAQLLVQMPKVFGSVQTFAQEMGFAQSETFTLNTGHNILSFFSDGDVCLSVSHDDQNFEIGVREKLLLIARGAARLDA